MDGRCWVCNGPRRAQASPDEERRLTEKRRYADLPYDMRGVVGSSVDRDLDERSFEDDYLPCAVFPEALEENERERPDQMSALRLVALDGLPTGTAILILGRDPGAWFPGAYVQFVRYNGTEVTDPIGDQKEVRGTLAHQLRQIDNLLKVNILTGMQFGERHREQPDYGPDLWRSDPGQPGSSGSDRLPQSHHRRGYEEPGVHGAVRNGLSKREDDLSSQ